MNILQKKSNDERHFLYDHTPINNISLNKTKKFLNIPDNEISFIYSPEVQGVKTEFCVLLNPKLDLIHYIYKDKHNLNVVYQDSYKITKLNDPNCFTKISFNKQGKEVESLSAIKVCAEIVELYDIAYNNALLVSYKRSNFVTDCTNFLHFATKSLNFKVKENQVLISKIENFLLQSNVDPSNNLNSKTLKI